MGHGPSPRTLEILTAFDAGEKRLDMLAERFGGNEAGIQWLLKYHGRKGWRWPSKVMTAETERALELGAHKGRRSGSGFREHSRPSRFGGRGCAGIDPDFDGAA